MNDLRKTHEKGTYIAAHPIQANKDQLYGWVTENGISNPLSSDEYHCTITYSRKPCKEAEAHDFKLPMNATISGFKIFDAGIGRCLVATLDSEDLHTVNSEIKETYGATSDFDSYIPHMTLSYNYVGDIPADHPKMNIWFNRVEVKGIDPDWKPKK